MATPSPYKEIKKMSIKTLAGKRVTKKALFLGEEIIIKKLSIADVELIQTTAKAIEDANNEYLEALKQYELDLAKAKADDTELPVRPEEPEQQDTFAVLKTIIRSATEDGESLTDDDFQNFALDDLTKLSEEIMNFSGVGEKARKGK